MIIEIKQLVSKGIFKGFEKTSGYFKDEFLKVQFETWKVNDNIYLSLKYKTDDYYGNQHKMNLEVNIEKRKSNLGTGELFLFICPFCSRSCRKLLKVNYSINFKCRKCYSTLPYPTQSSSKMWRANSQYFSVKNKLEQLSEMRYAGAYNGKITKRAKRVQYLENKLQKYDYQRCSPASFSLKFRRLIFK